MNMAGACIFCKIVAGELPSVRIYEDADTLAFMDIGPVVKGHALVIPRTHHDPITSAPPETLQKLILVVQKIAAAQFRNLKADGVNVTQANGRVAGQIVQHIHFHVIPRFEADGHHFNWTPGKYDNDKEMQDFADRLKPGLAANDA